MNIAEQINSVIRHLISIGDGHTVMLTKTFPTSAEDLWAACTEPDRLQRWFVPVEGDLHEGGRYHLTGINTEGTIEQCEAPSTLRVTWEYDGDISHVSLTIADAADGATLTLAHAVANNDHWHTYGPGATGVGWDGSVLALSLFLADDPRASQESMAAFSTSPDGRHFLAASVANWERAHVAAGAAPDIARQAAQRTHDAYRGEETPA